MVYGCHRTSTNEQHLDREIAKIDRLGRNTKDMLKNLEICVIKCKGIVLDFLTTLIDFYNT